MAHSNIVALWAAAVALGSGLAAAQPEYRVRAVAEFGWASQYNPFDSYAISGGVVRAELTGSRRAIYSGTSLDSVRVLLDDSGSSYLPVREGGSVAVTGILDAAFAPDGTGVVAASLADGRRGIWMLEGPPGEDTFSPLLLSGDVIGDRVFESTYHVSLRAQGGGYFAALVHLADDEPVILAGGPDGVRVAVRRGQVLSDGSVVQDLGFAVLWGDDYFKSRVFLAADGSVRTVVLLEDREYAVIVEDGGTASVLMRTVDRFDADDRPFRMWDARGTADGTLAVTGEVDGDGLSNTGVWSITPEGEVRLEVLDIDFEGGSEEWPSLASGDYPAPPEEVVPLADGSLIVLATHYYGGLLARIQDGELQYLTGGEQTPSPLFGDRVVGTQSTFAAEPSGNLLIGWDMGAVEGLDRFALFVVDVHENRSKVVVRLDRPLFAGSGVEREHLLTYAPFEPSSGGEGLGQHIDSEGRVVFNSYPHVFLAEPVGPCPQDVNEDGSVDVLDVMDYLRRFRVGEQYAEWTRDWDTNVMDLLAFLGDFRRGCPSDPQERSDSLQAASRVRR